MIGLREHDQKLTKPRPKQTIPDQANKKAPKRINHLGAITGGGGGILLGYRYKSLISNVFVAGSGNENRTSARTDH